MPLSGVLLAGCVPQQQVVAGYGGKLHQPHRRATEGAMRDAPAGYHPQEFESLRASNGGKVACRGWSVSIGGSSMPESNLTTRIPNSYEQDEGVTCGLWSRGRSLVRQRRAGLQRGTEGLCLAAPALHPFVGRLASSSPRNSNTVFRRFPAWLPLPFGDQESATRCFGSPASRGSSLPGRSEHLHTATFLQLASAASPCHSSARQQTPSSASPCRPHVASPDAETCLGRCPGRSTESVGRRLPFCYGAVYRGRA
jgi:hypothetical protein